MTVDPAIYVSTALKVHLIQILRYYGSEYLQSADAARGTDLSHKVAQLEKELKDKEGREGKFKQLTLKAKKETQDYKAKVQPLIIYFCKN